MRWLLVILFVLGGVPDAGAVTFDFEGEAATSSGALDSLSITQGFLTMTVTRTFDNGVPCSLGAGSLPCMFDIVDNSQFTSIPTGWQQRALDPFYQNPNVGVADDDTWMLLSFSHALLTLSVEMTDFGPNDDVLEMKLFSGPGASGVQVGTAPATDLTVTWPDFETLGFDCSSSSVCAVQGGFMSALLRGRDFLINNGAYIDNVEVAAVPEPGSGALLGFGVGAVAAASALSRRRK
jgi:hypothetical protein